MFYGSGFFFIWGTLSCSVNHFKPAIRNQRFRDADAFGRLVILQQSGHDTGQSQSGSVQRMAKFNLLVRIAVTAFQTVGLISVEIGNRAYFQPAFLCFAVNFKVVADGGREAHVAPTKAENTVGKFQFL